MTSQIPKPDIPVANSFSALYEPQATENPSEQNDMLAFMNEFAHRVHLGKKQAQNHRKPREDIDGLLKEFDCNPRAMKEKQVIVKTEDDLNRPQVRKFIKPLPDDPREIIR